jgi:hypothetical protein
MIVPELSKSVVGYKRVGMIILLLNIYIYIYIYFFSFLVFSATKSLLITKLLVLNELV